MRTIAPGASSHVHGEYGLGNVIDFTRDKGKCYNYIWKLDGSPWWRKCRSLKKYAQIYREKNSVEVSGRCHELNSWMQYCKLFSGHTLVVEASECFIKCNICYHVQMLSTAPLTLGIVPFVLHLDQLRTNSFYHSGLVSDGHVLVLIVTHVEQRQPCTHVANCIQCPLFKKNNLL